MIIGARFNGPPGSGNGGYSSGVFSGALESATVTLRRPPPLDVPLTVRRSASGVEVYSPDEDLVAEVAEAAPVDGVVPPVSVAEASTVAASYPGFVEHPFPTCYVCGPERPLGDGLGIFPGVLVDGRTAGVWRVPPEVRRETVWAALDCPGGWTIVSPGRPFVLGRMTCSVFTVPAPSTVCVVVGELRRIDGRKAFVRTTLYARAAPLAAAEAVWLAI